MAMGSGMDKFVLWLLEHGQEAGLSIWILLTFLGYAVALNRGLLYTKGRYQDLHDRWEERDHDCDDRDAILHEVEKRLVDQRILNERATLTIENLKETQKAQELEIARLKGALQKESRARR